MKNTLSAELLSFLSQHIQSVRQLECLLFLHARPAEVWSTDVLARSIFANEAITKHWLEEFQQQGLLAVTEKGFAFITTGAKARRVGSLAQEYKLRPTKVIEAIMKGAISC